MSTASTGLVTTARQELAALGAAVITPADRGYDQAPQSWNQRC